MTVTVQEAGIPKALQTGCPLLQCATPMDSLVILSAAFSLYSSVDHSNSQDSLSVF